VGILRVLTLNKSILIIGNGPSVSELDLKRVKIASFGMNSAYRHFLSIGWFPTYHGCFDELVCSHHNNNFIDYVEKSDERLKCFYAPRITKKDKKPLNKKIIQTGWTEPTFRFKLPQDGKYYFENVGSTGANCCQIAIALGYNRLYLIGIDLNHKREKGLKRIGGKRVIVGNNPTNINYGFEGYLQKGDVLNLPNLDKYHFPAWDSLSSWYKNNGIEVINCSADSAIKDLFPYISLNDADIYK
jgi:hypothetical protein